MIDAVIGLGSNLGNRLATLEAAIERIGKLPDTHLVATSTLRETDPVGPPQGRYVNGAVRITTELDPEALLDALLRIERDLGRVRDPALRWGPRTIDLDVLWVDGVVFQSPTLTLPHPSLHERVFALTPLVEVAPEAVDPKSHARYVDLLAALGDGHQPE